jgi:hypothetical protein
MWSNAKSSAKSKLNRELIQPKAARFLQSSLHILSGQKKMSVKVKIPRR